MRKDAGVPRGMKGRHVKQINVERLSLKELLSLAVKVKRALAIARERERTEVKKQIEELARESGFTLDELFGQGRSTLKGRKVAPKYVNPENRSETWSGRGRKPKWLVAKVKKGAKIEQFAI